jgi:fructose-bisphosphate aldolase, class II
MLAKGKQVLQKAQAKGYAVGHFNVSNMEIVQAVAEAAEKTRSPVFIAVTETALSYAGFDYIVSLIKLAAKKATVPVVLHLDHGKDLRNIRRCVAAGFSSVMCDASYYKFAKNVSITREVVSLAHAKGISVEAELGMVTTKVNGLEMEEKRSVFTDPMEAKEFVKRTGVDSLAVSIGTSHGAYKFESTPLLDIERLRLIRQVVDIPLVLHGASQIPQKVVRKALKLGAKWKGAKGLSLSSMTAACRNGISKVNMHTDLSLVYMLATMEFLAKNREEMDERTMLAYSRDAVRQYVIERMMELGSSGKA